MNFVLSACKISQPYKLYGSLGRTPAPEKGLRGLGDGVRWCVCVYVLVLGSVNVSTRFWGYRRHGPLVVCKTVPHPMNNPIWMD